jgi:hypothetical protein
MKNKHKSGRSQRSNLCLGLISQMLNVAVSSLSYLFDFQILFGNVFFLKTVQDFF